MKATTEEDGAADEAIQQESCWLGQHHVKFIRSTLNDEDSLEWFFTEHLRMGGVYWSLCTFALMGVDLDTLKDSAWNRQSLRQWIIKCQAPSGGIAPHTGHDPHLSATTYALFGLVLIGDDLTESDSLNFEAAAQWVASLQNPLDGSFAGDVWGECDTRFCFLALMALTVLDRLDLIDVPKATQYIRRCRNSDGAFGPTPNAESHAAYTFCCVQALALLMALHHADANELGQWLSKRQLAAGGFNGRPEKAPDVCYTWWIMSSLATIGRAHWIDSQAVQDFVVESQDRPDGGIADRPGNIPDVFHTFFGTAGLALIDRKKFGLAAIHPVYVLPVDLVKKLRLPLLVDC